MTSDPQIRRHIKLVIALGLALGAANAVLTWLALRRNP
jgi:hypothetical protein